MEFGSLFCDYQLSKVQDIVACNLCALDPLTNPVVTACDHCFCWPCMYQFLQGQAKPCPVCSTMLSSDTNVTPTFDSHGVLVLRLPIAEEVEPNCDDDDTLDWSGTAAAFAPATVRLEEEPIARRDLDMAVALFDEATKFKGNGPVSV